MKEYSKGPKTHKLSIVPSEVKWFVQSNDPDDFEDPEIQIPSVAAELTYNFKQYSVDRKTEKSEWIKIFFSTKTATIINTIKHQVKFSRPPGLSPTLCCTIAQGLPVLLSKRVIKKLGELSHEFGRMQKHGTSLELYIQSFFESKVECVMDNGRAINIALTSDVKDQIDLISGDTGLTIASVSMLAIYASLVQQNETPPEYKREWQEVLDRSMATVECKLNAAKSMMKSLETQNEAYN